MHANSPKALLLTLLAAAMTCVVVLQPGFSSPPAAPSTDEALDRAMVGLKDGLRSLSKSLADASLTEDSLKTLTEMQGHVMSVKDADPQNLEEVEEARRPAHKLAFRADMMRLMRELCEMEIEVCEGKHEDALARVMGQLVPLRNSSHEKYQKN